MRSLHYDATTGIFTFTQGRRKGKVAGTQHDARGFLKVSINNQSHLLHRLAWLAMTGTMPRWNIEHINGDHGDNRWSNLREGGRMQKRRHSAPRREPTAMPGVWKVGDRFEAMVDVEGMTANLGAFDSAENAAKAIADLRNRVSRRRVKQLRQAA